MNKIKESYIEVIALFFLSIIIFILSTLQVQDIVSIWNQNDEFGVWQGGAWVLGLDWSEVVSTNGYYGYGYGFILAAFIKLFGHNTVLMTQMAIYFQALMHTSSIFIAWYCIRKLFPSVNVVERVIVSSVCILSIPDLFYNYMFFSECILRFLVWLTFAIVVSYSYNKKWYKLLLVNLIAVYSFSIHQRCILLVGMSILMFLYESINCLRKNGIKKNTVLRIVVIAVATLLFYQFEYKYAQTSYIASLYSVNGTTDVGGNLLSERGYTFQSIFRDVVFNLETEKIAFQNVLGMIYYISAFDCGFTFYGFILCTTIIWRKIISKSDEIIIPHVYISCMVLLGILLVTYQNANIWVYERVEAMHYGRYCSYLLSPMIMIGIVELLTETNKIIKNYLSTVVCIFLLSGISTYIVLKDHNVTDLFAFANACPGIRSVYYTENPFSATLYHTVLGVLWITIPSILIAISNRLDCRRKYFIQIIVFIVISSVWIKIANSEWRETHDSQNVYVTQTYDLQNVLNNEKEFVAFKSHGRYGSGLLQYNNVYSKMHVLQELDEFNEDEDGLLVVSQKGIAEMAEIIQKYNIEYENERYFVWRYETKH